MQDLLPLCELHHLAAEELVDKGLIPRTGDVLFLATETIRLIIGGKIQIHRHEKRIYEHPELPKCELRNRFQKKLIEEDWFLQALKKTSPEFKRIVRNKFDGQPGRMRMMSNCFALFDRLGHRGRMDLDSLPKYRISRLICLNSATDL